MWESFCLDSKYFRSKGCLELRSRTARAIAGHIEENLGECIRQNTHLRRQCPGLRSFGVFQSRKVFFFKTEFNLSVIEASAALL